ncbi:MAG: hypothetical protein EH225_13635 [Calditrichaeota bacterium]|nr:hypothetical protein [Calditrichota bacterium]RQV98174.1 MAG: hypothetical protein EH225_13635 [Calditrichota bacterium]
MKAWVITLFLAAHVFAAFEYTVREPLAEATGGSMIASRDKLSSFLLNPALSAFSPGLLFSLVYIQPYNLSELNSGGAIGRFSSKSFGSGLAFSAFGNDLYQENKITVNFSKGFLNQKFFVGLNLNWFSIRLKEFEGYDAPGIDIGIQYLIDSRVGMGFSVLNVNQPEINGISQQIPLITRWGLSICWSDRFSSYMAMEKDVRFPLSVRFAVQIKLAPFMSLYSGMTSYPSVPALGIGFIRKWITIQYAYQHHFDLGGSHLWGLTFSRIK